MMVNGYHFPFLLTEGETVPERSLSGLDGTTGGGTVLGVNLYQVSPLLA